MLVERGVVRIGMEVEVAKYKPGNTNQTIAQRLIDEGYMYDDGSGWAEVHRYRCRCERVCNLVRRGDVLIPPLVSLTYDASLPEDGGEWVISPIILADQGLEMYEEIWDIITAASEWRNDILDRRGEQNASPSIHLHVSATTQAQNRRANNPYNEIERVVGRVLADPAMRSSPRGDDIYHALSLFGPEFILLASTADIKRGLYYRQPIRYPDQNGHHGFVHVRNVQPNMVHIEWRMFEAAYEDWDYLQAGAYLAAGLTRGLLNRETLAQLMRAGYSHYVDQDAVEAVTQADDVDGLLRLVSHDRLQALRQLVVSEIDDDPPGVQKVNALFEKGLALL